MTLNETEECYCNGGLVVSKSPPNSSSYLKVHGMSQDMFACSQVIKK